MIHFYTASIYFNFNIIFYLGLITENNFYNNININNNNRFRGVQINTPINLLSKWMVKHEGQTALSQRSHTDCTCVVSTPAVFSISLTSECSSVLLNTWDPNEQCSSATEQQDVSLLKDNARAIYLIWVHLDLQHKNTNM